jgi:hypothetical protein
MHPTWKPARRPYFNLGPLFGLSMQEALFRPWRAQRTSARFPGVGASAIGPPRARGLFDGPDPLEPPRNRGADPHASLNPAQIARITATPGWRTVEKRQWSVQLTDENFPQVGEHFFNGPRRDRSPSDSDPIHWTLTPTKANTSATRARGKILLSPGRAGRHLRAR